jgi:hypothetical protein
MGPKGSALSDFRRNLLVTDGDALATGDDAGAHLTDLMKGKSDGDSGVTAGIHNNNGDNKTLKKIAYRTIMQARQEMPLVKLQLQRHKRGEPGEYVTEQNYMDISVSSKLPAHYYNDVACCLNCFKVYSIISEAREKAVTKLDVERKRAEALRLDGDDGSIQSVSGSQASLHTDSRASRQLQKRSNPGTFGKQLFSPVKTGPASRGGRGLRTEGSVDSLDDGGSVGSASFMDSQGMDASGMGSYRGLVGSPTSLSEGPPRGGSPGRQRRVIPASSCGSHRQPNQARRGRDQDDGEAPCCSGGSAGGCDGIADWQDHDFQRHEAPYWQEARPSWSCFANSSSRTLPTLACGW